MSIPPNVGWCQMDRFIRGKTAKQNLFRNQSCNTTTAYSRARICSSSMEWHYIESKMFLKLERIKQYNFEVSWDLDFQKLFFKLQTKLQKKIFCFLKSRFSVNFNYDLKKDQLANKITVETRQTIMKLYSITRVYNEKSFSKKLHSFCKSDIQLNLSLEINANLCISIFFNKINQSFPIKNQNINTSKSEQKKVPELKMYITKQIINEKHRKSVQPHKKQILSEIQASIDNQQWEINKQTIHSNFQSTKQKCTRPKTANISSKPSIIVRPNTATFNRCSSAQQIEKRSNHFVKKINYQFNQIKEITSLFDSFFGSKKSKVYEPQLFNYPQKVQKIKAQIKQKQNQQKLNFQKIKRERSQKIKENQTNQYLGYPKEKVNKTIPIRMAKHQNIHMITRCIKGGYVQQRDQFSDIVNKPELLKLKKNFITLNTLYEGVKKQKNKGIGKMKPQDVDKSSFQNLVYFLQNERNLKLTDKKVIQQKMKLIS